MVLRGEHGLTPALYARVSTQDQDCAGQIRELREFCERRGWKVKPEHEYIDQGISGSKAKRPGLDALMDAAFHRRIDCILVVKVDRFGRSVLHFTQQLQLLASYGVRFIATSQAIDTDVNSPVAGLLMRILAAVAEFERDMIRERTISGLRNARANGRIGGRPRREFDASRVARMREEGLSWQTISRKMGGIPISTLRQLPRRRKAG